MTNTHLGVIPQLVRCLKSKASLRGEVDVFAFWPSYGQAKQNSCRKDVVSPPAVDCFMFPYMSSDIRQAKGFLKHLCCDCLKHDLSSPLSEDLHSTHSYTNVPDYFNIYVQVKEHF